METKYIKLDDIQKILKLYRKWPLSMENHLDMFDKINSLDTINSPSDVIDNAIKLLKEDAQMHEFSDSLYARWKMNWILYWCEKIEKANIFIQGRT